MTAEQLEHIQAHIEEYDQDNPVIRHIPERDWDNYVYIFGSSFGVVLIPESDGRITFTLLVEDDEHWFIREGPIISHNFWISDLIKCLDIAQEYLKQNATTEYFVNTDEECGYKLPYKN